MIVIDNNQSQEEILLANAPLFFEIASVYSEIPSNPLTFIRDLDEYSFSDNSPPPSQSLFKLHCSLSAQSKIIKTTFKVYGNCVLCKKRIETALDHTGIKHAV